MVIADEKFPKSYMLCSRDTLSEVYSKGKGVFKHPFSAKILVGNKDLPEAFEIAISVPKRRIPKAHDRNKIKRKVKEALRKNKNILESFLSQSEQSMSILLVYSTNEAMEYKDIEKQLIKLLQIINDKFNKNETRPTA